MKTYLTIMKDVLGAIINGGSKPELSPKDWKFILAALIALDNISKEMNTINPEYFKYQCERNFEAMEDVTGYNIISKEEDKE